MEKPMGRNAGDVLVFSWLCPEGLFSRIGPENKWLGCLEVIVPGVIVRLQTITSGFAIFVPCWRTLLSGSFSLWFV